MLVKKQLFFGYLFLFISIFASLFYTLNLEYVLGPNNDTFGYLDGFNYLAQNKFDIQGVQEFFGYGFPEFIYVYLFSVLTFFTGTIKSPNTLMFLLTCCTFALVTFAYLNINKIYSKHFSISTIGLQLQILASTLPLGLTIQTSRQSFGFFLFLSLIIITRKIKFLSFLLPALTLVSTHFRSSVLIIGEYLVRKKNYFLLICYVASITFLAFFLFYDIYFYKVGSSRFIDFSKFWTGDKYVLVSLILLILIKGKSFLFDLRFFFFSCATFLYFLITQYGQYSRMFFGLGWFWVALLGIQLIGEVKLIQSSTKINIFCSVICLSKLVTLFQLLSS